MNERIRALAEQAGLLGPSSRVGNAHEATEKFAELLFNDIAMFSMVITDDHYDVDSLYRHYGVEL